jgi:DNA mismatch repair protein MutL
MPEDRTYSVIGEALGTYILVEQGESLWLIDKHAAHERIHFDRLKAEKQVIMSQTLLEPVLCELGREETAILLENAGLFEQLGFRIEPFGETAFAVRHAPAVIEASDIAVTLGEMLQILRRGGSPTAACSSTSCCTRLPAKPPSRPDGAPSGRSWKRSRGACSPARFATARTAARSRWN